MRKPRPKVCYFRLLCLAVLLAGLGLVASCARKVPVIVYEQGPLGDGGRLLREFYRSYWMLPADDGDILTVGIIPPRDVLRFRALTPIRIRAYSDRDSWEVASPEGVRWILRSTGVARPLVAANYAVVETMLAPPQAPPSATLPLRWKHRGYPSARWIGPPAMDVAPAASGMWHWSLSLTPPSGALSAKAICAEVLREWKAPCRVIQRVDLPPLASGILEAENSNFRRLFRGYLEIVSPLGPVEVSDVIVEERTGERSRENYGPRLFAVPDPTGRLAFIQRVPLGEYLEGVVSSEIFPQAPIEALKSQAIVARTYALRHIRDLDASQPYAICGSTKCQVYRGVDYRRPATSQAVRETAGIVLREPDGVDLAETYYHAICGGHTESRAAVWGMAPLSYLMGSSDLPMSIPDPLLTDGAVDEYLSAPASAFCGRASLTKNDRWRWVADLGSKEIQRLLETATLPTPLTDIRVLRRGKSGRAVSIEVQSGQARKTIRGELEIRRLLGGLLSSLFVMDLTHDGPNISHIRVRGGGYGHGIGLCQIGAIGRAEQGQTYREILSAYYPGALLGTLPMNGAAAMVK